MHVSLISNEEVEELTQGKDFTINDRQVTLAAPTDLKIKIYRVTTTKPLVGWADASVLRAADMTVQSTQLLHLAEETSDLAQDGGLSKDTADNVWDARFNKIKNLLDPTEPGDAVTLSYITKKQTGLLTQLNATGAAQNASIVATGDTQNARLVTTGNSYVNTMTTLRDATTTKATEANNSAALAKKWAVSASSPDGATDSKSSKTWAEAAKVLAGNAAASASAAQSSATASQNSANSASGSASTATTKATEASNSATSASSSASTATTKANEANTSAISASNSAIAAAKSAENAKTWDPTSYYTKTEVDNKISNEVVQVPVTIVDTTAVNNNYVICQKSGHVVFLRFEVKEAKENLSPGNRNKAIFTNLPHAVTPVILSAFSVTGNNWVRFLISDDYFSWHYSPTYKSSGGNECIICVTYLTND